MQGAMGDKDMGSEGPRDRGGAAGDKDMGSEGPRDRGGAAGDKDMGSDGPRDRGRLWELGDGSGTINIV